MKAIVTAMLFLLIFAASTFADESAPNCRLAVRTKMKSGKKKVEVEEMKTFTRDECKLKAKERETASQADEDVESIKVSFGFREPASVKKH